MEKLRFVRLRAAAYYFDRMSLREIIAELPSLSTEERWELVERAMELDDFSEAELKLIDDRLADYERDPATWVPLEEMIAKLRMQQPKELNHG